MKKKMIVALVFLILTILTIVLMVIDYSNYPPLKVGEPGWEYMNNYEGSLINHVLLVSIGFILFSIKMFKQTINYAKWIDYLLLIVFMANLVWALSSTMFMGGIAVLYTIWSIILLILGIVYFFSNLKISKQVPLK